MEGAKDRGLNMCPTLHCPSLIPASTYLQLQPGGGFCTHPIGKGALQAFSTEGPIAGRPLTNEIQQILVMRKGWGERDIQSGGVLYFQPRPI